MNRLPLRPLLLAMVMLCSAVPASAAIITYQEGATTPFVGGTYAGAQETMILANGPGEQDQNFGARINFDVGTLLSIPGFVRHGLVRFDITSLNGQFSTVDSAILRLFLFTGSAGNREGAGTVQVFPIAPANAGWVEGTGTTTPGGDPPDTGQSTWDQRVQGSQNWAGTEGASTPGTDFLLLQDSEAFNFATGGPPDGTPFDFTISDLSLIPQWAAGNNPGLYLDAGGGVISFHSSESTSTQFRPMLIIAFDSQPSQGVPEPNMLLLLVCGLLALFAVTSRRTRRQEEVK